MPNAFFGSYATNGAQCRYNGVITPASDNYRLGFPGANGALHIMQPLVDIGTPRGLIVGGGTPNLVAENTFTGDTVLRDGRLFLGRKLALQNSALNVGNGVDGNTGKICFNNGPGNGAPTPQDVVDEPHLGGLIGSRNLASIYSSSNQNNTSRLAIGDIVGITLNVDSGKTHTYSGNARLSTGMYLTKDGPGTQVLSGTNDYTGPTSIATGTLSLGTTGSIADSTLLAIGAGGTLDTSGQASYAIPATQTVDFGIQSAGAGSAGKIVADELDISSATVTYNISGPLDDAAYVLATYTSLVGANFASVPAPPSGYTLNYAYEGNKIALVPTGVVGPTDEDDAVSIADFTSSLGFDPTGGGGTGGTTGAASGTFAGFSGGSYSVEWSPDLVTLFTTVFGPEAGTGTSGTAGVAIPWSYDTDDTEGFFRLVITP